MRTVKVVRGLSGFKKRPGGTVLTIGNFDGIHLGHLKIFNSVIKRAREYGGVSMAVSFDPHPLKVLRPEVQVLTLTPIQEKERLIRLAGIDILLLIKFTKAFASLSAEDFIRKILVGKLGVKTIVVGHNYIFGKGRKGTTGLLRRMGRRHGFTLKVVRSALVGGDVVSSSRIRGLLLKGDARGAAELLGRPYMIEGKVVKGTGRGTRILGIPTANIRDPRELPPKPGVYAVYASFNKKLYNAVANIGFNPTFGERRISYEVHLMGLNRREAANILPGKNLRVYFVQRLRDEKRFPDAGSLEAAIRRDISLAEETLIKYRRLKPI